MASTAISQMSKQELAQKWRSIKASRDRLKQKTEEATGRAVNAASTVGGGAAVGVMRGLDLGAVPGTDGAIKWDAAVAAALSTLAIFDMGGKYNEQLGAFGFGMGAAAVAGPVEEAVRKARKE